MGLSWWHVAIVLVIFVLLFGAGRISNLMADIAKGLKSFNKAMGEDDEVKLVENKGTNLPSSRIASRTAAAQKRKRVPI